MRDRQKAILSLFHKRRAEGKPPPTLREIVENTDITSTSVAKYNLDVLVRRGELIWAGENIARAYRLPYDNEDNDTAVYLTEHIAELEDTLQLAEKRINELERELLSERSKHLARQAWVEKR